MSIKESNKRKVLFVYPEVPVSYWSFKHVLSFIGKKSAFPPLGLLTIAGLLPDDYDIKLVDMNIEPLSEDDIIQSELVFISAMIIQKKSFQKVVEMSNRLGVPVVAGGPYPTVQYQNIDGVDYFVLNEAEITLPQFLDDYEKGIARQIYTTEEKPDINTAPIPRFDLCNVNNYSTMMLQFSRGCPYHCEFCDIVELFGHTPRTKTPQKFIAEMETLYQTGFRGTVFIVDDNFIGNKHKVKDLLPEIIEFQKKYGYPFHFDTEASVDLANDDELLNLMQLAGFGMVFLGIETPDEESLLAMHKKQNTKTDLMAGIRKIQSAGIEVSGGFIVGFDTDPDDIFDRQIRFIDQSAIPMAMVGLLTVLPNTQLHRRLTAENRVIGESSGNNTHDFTLNYQPVMDPETLISGYKRVIKSIYTPKNYFKRCSELVGHMKSVKNRPKTKITLSLVVKTIKSFFRSFRTQLFSSYGWDYLKFFIRSLFNKPSLFAISIKKGALGHHFIKISNEMIELEHYQQFVSEHFNVLKSHLDSMHSESNLVSVIKMLSIHKKIMTLTFKIVKKASKSPFVHIESTLSGINSIFIDYLFQLNNIIGEKVKDFQYTHFDIFHPRFKVKDIIKIIQIHKKNRRILQGLSNNIRETYNTVEEQIRNLVMTYMKPALVPVKMDS